VVGARLNVGWVYRFRSPHGRQKGVLSMAAPSTTPVVNNTNKTLHLVAPRVSGQQKIESSAFHQAQLESERIRILSVVGFAAIFIVVTLTRVFLIRTGSGSTPLGWNLVMASTVIAYEGWMLHRINVALKVGRTLSNMFWALNTILESSIPAFGVAFLTSEQIEAAYRPLSSPAVLVFFIFIILSTLRLSPWICVLSGVVAAASYVTAAFYLGWRPPVFGMPAPVTQTSVSLYVIVLFLGGIVAAAIASRIRTHVEAALREAETKGQLERIQHDLQVARSIQQSLLPKEEPKIAGFDIAGWNQPADDTGGDYFDWQVLSNGRLVVTLADVTGHGIGPALLAAVCHAYARSSFRFAPTVLAAFEHINQALSPDLGPGRFVTFVAAMCGPNNPELEILSAGHGPLFIYLRKDDRVTEMSAQAVPFGILPFFKSDPVAKLQLNPGDLVLLATDGFFEWENLAGEQFGAKRLVEVIRAYRDYSPREIIANLYDVVTRFSSGSKQQDDLTAVIIKRL
jgi:serine phosphatase RsbU (regulator of sigma subunit)